VRVHIDSPVSAQLAADSGYTKWYIQPPRHGGPDRPVCDAPCDDAFTGTYRNLYRITGQFPRSPAFSLYNLTGDVTITVQPGSYGRRAGGFWAVLLGPFTFLPGLGLLGIGGASGEKALSGVGIGFMVTGGLAAITGIVLLATSSTKIKLQQSGLGPVGNAAPVKPRYWMGEF
jgi:hypothetical protein